MAILARQVQLMLLFAARLCQSLMRMALGPLIVFICDDMACTAATKGHLLSAFSLGYLTTQVGGGLLADRLGPKLVILLATVAAAGLTIASAACDTVDRLFWAQVLMGAAQGPLFPTSVSYLTRWLPPDERSSASSFLDAGITAGSLVALPFSGRLAAAVGWSATLVAWGVVSLAFAAAWALLACTDPLACAYMGRAEREHLKATVAALGGGEAAGGGAAAADARPSMGAMELLARRELWAIFAAHGAFNFGVYFVTSWSPTYYQEALALRPEEWASLVAFSLPPLLNLAVSRGAMIANG